MFRFIDRLPLRLKLSLALILPLLGMTFFAVGNAFERRAEASEAEDLQLLVELSVKTGNLLHETQKERGATAVYMGSGGTRFEAEMGAQRLTTDGPRAEFFAFLDENREALPIEVVEGLEPAVQSLDQLDRQRSDASALAVETGQVIGYFTSMNARFLDGIAAVASASSNAELRGDSVAYLAFLNAKEKTGVERAQLAAAFSSDAFVPGQFATVVSLIAAQEAFLGLFQDIANQETLAFFEQKQADPLVAEVARLEAIAVTNGVGDFGVDGGEWFDTMTARINLLKEVENAQAVDIAETAAELAADARATFYRSLLVAALIIAISGLFGATTTYVLIHQLQTVAAQAGAIASGDLAAEVFSEEGPGEISPSFSAMLASLRGMVHQLKTSSSNLADSAQDLSGTSTTLSNRADDTSTQAKQATATVTHVAAEVTSVAAAVEEMKHTISEIATNTLSASTMATEAVEAADHTSVVIAKLGESSDRIGDVVTVINTIAEQTNLLALNATIEAARAGDAGKGFAVVANEVKQLATETSQATTDISDSIQGIQHDMTNAVEANGRIAETIRSINDISTMIATAVEEQRVTAGEIARSVENAAAGTTEISEVVDRVTASAETSQRTTVQLNDAASRMSDLAGSLDQLVADYRLPETASEGQLVGGGRHAPGQ